MFSLNQGSFYNKKINSFKYLEKNIKHYNLKEGNTNMKLPPKTERYMGKSVLDVDMADLYSKLQRDDYKEFNKLYNAYNRSLNAYKNAGNSETATTYNTYLRNAIRGDSSNIENGVVRVADDKGGDVDGIDVLKIGEKGKYKNFIYFIEKYLENGFKKDDEIKALINMKDIDNDNETLFEKNRKKNESKKTYIKEKIEIDKLRKNKEEKIREIKKYNIHIFTWSVAGISLGGVLIYYFFKK